MPGDIKTTVVVDDYDTASNKKGEDLDKSPKPGTAANSHAKRSDMGSVEGASP